MKLKFAFKSLITGAAMVAAVAWLPPVQAQQYPQRTIRVVVPFGPGGGTDYTGRLVAQILGDAFKSTVIVENRPGASGIIGSDVVAKSAPDGYTLMASSTQELTINQHLFSKLPFVPERDFTPMTQVVNSPLVLVAHPGVAAQSVRELIAAARAQPGKLTFASSGNGSGGHLAGELLNINEKINIRHIPYKGASAAMADLLGGQVDMGYVGLSVALPQLKAGKLRAIAVTTAKRSPFAPDIPTMVESGATGYEVNNWFGVFVPTGMPPDIFNRIHAAIVQGLEQPEVRARLAGQGFEPVGSSAADFKRFVQNETMKYQRVIKEADIKLD